MTKDKKTLTLDVELGGRPKNEVVAEASYDPVARSLLAADVFITPVWGEQDLVDRMKALNKQVKNLSNGSLSIVEQTLVAQANTLDAVFNLLTQKAGCQIDSNLDAFERYMRLALKAQGQCRTSLETLAEIKNPRPVAFVKQANIANGHQQINNGVQPSEPLAHGNSSIQSNELSGADHELLPDTRASSIESRVDTPMETVGKIDRAKVSSRKSSKRKERGEARLTGALDA